MTYFELEKKFTAIVSEYISKGYVIAPCNTASTTDTNIALTNGNTNIKVMLWVTTVPVSDTDYHAYTMEYKLTVTEYPTMSNLRMMLNGTTLTTETYYEIANGYLGTFEQAIHRYKVHKARINRPRNFKNLETDTYKRIVLPFVRRQPRCKSKTIADIRGISHFNGVYTVYLYNGKTFDLK